MRPGIAGMVLAATIALGLSVCGTAAARDGGPPAQSSIIKGTAASIADFPWLSHVTYIGKREGFECTGTVVAPRIVLTAAHCTLSEAGRIENPANYRVVTGIADLREATAANVSSVSRVLVAPGYDGTTHRHDAALLILSAPVAAPPIPIAHQADAGLLGPGAQMEIAGWGLTKGTARRTPPVLRKAQTVIQSDDFCSRHVKVLRIGFDPEAQLCAISLPERETGSCHGDSGGPGIVRRPDGSAVQVGVIDFGLTATCETDSPEYQTRVDAEAEWIDRWIAATELGAAPPEVFVPPLLRLPKLSFGLAKYLAWEALAANFNRRFLQGKYKEIACRRLDREKVKCDVFWYHAAKVYVGAITIYLSLPREGTIWNYRFRVRRYGVTCWVNRKHPRGNCPGVLYYR